MQGKIVFNALIEKQKSLKDSEQSKTWYEEFMTTCTPQQRQNLYGEVAETYNRVRPHYPQALIDRVVEVTQLPANAIILEVGCGPGTATVEFAKFGFSMLCLDPSPEACQLARQNCLQYPQVEIQNTTFEAWELQPKRYNAVLAATSFHWVSPDVGYCKVADALQDGGSLVLLWNAEVQPKDEVYQRLNEVYLTQAPSLARFHAEHRENREEDLKKFGQAVIDSGLFENLISEQIQCEVTYCIEDYLALLRTYSPYIRLEEQHREALLASLREALENNCPKKSIPASYLSVFQIARKIAI
jgi:SAM-dependent methyltransferase